MRWGVVAASLGIAACAAPADYVLGTTHDAAASDILEGWREHVGPVSLACEDVVRSTTYTFVAGPAGVEAACGLEVDGCVVHYPEGVDDAPAAVVLVEGSPASLLVHEYAHVLSRCEIGAYDREHRNGVVWDLVSAIDSEIRAR